MGDDPDHSGSFYDFVGKLSDSHPQLREGFATRKSVGPWCPFGGDFANFRNALTFQHSIVPFNEITAQRDCAFG